MSSSIRITTLVENTAAGRGVLGEHGLAFWIEVANCRLLFDTGQGHVLHHNAKVLGVDLNAVDTVVLSHGHFDHAGGLRSLLDGARPKQAVAHPDVFSPKYIRRDSGEMMEIGMGAMDERRFRQSCPTVHLSREPLAIADGIVFTGEIPRRTDFEDTGGAFFADAEATCADPLLDDAALILDAAEGLVVLLGCAHSGVVNTLLHAAVLFGRKPVHAIIGGIHLLHASDARLDRTVRAMRENDVRLISPGHCTGWKATFRLASEFGDHVQRLHAGARFEF